MKPQEERGAGTENASALGWLFDLHPRGSRMALWFLLESGERLRLEERFEPEAYLDGPAREVAACLDAMERAGDATACGRVQKRDFWTGALRHVQAFRLRRMASWRRVLDRYAVRFPAVVWHNADLPMEQIYAFERDCFPLMRCRITHDGAGGLLAMQCLDDRWRTDFEPPPLRMASLHATGTLLGRRPRLESLSFECEGRETTWDDPREMLSGFQGALDEADPDVLLTEEGDAFLFPLLLTLAEQARFPLRLDREPPPEARTIRTDGRSFFSYGRILYQAPEYALFGRWHLDRRNSFTLAHDGMEGLFEVARLSRLPVQRVARRSIGTGISSIQLDYAWREGFLVPWKKTQPEAWKSARQLLATDRGGLVYAPETGFYEDVVELDFVAMYPSIMARFNVSPETVNCACCDNARVPEIDYTLCERRRGLVSRALAPIIAKRVAYKARRDAARAAGDEATRLVFHQRQDALKWMLVCCFGYLGYRNARFGRIEAHEAVSAFSREMLLRAREVCEQAGWRMLHANVDCVWIVKPGFREEEIAPLASEIERITGLPIALEGIYRWLAFLPSRQVPDRPVPTRYFGAFRDGSLKYRGIECRRSDLPRFVKASQLALLERLAQATDAAAYKACVPEMLAQIEEWEGMLWRHEVPLEDLAIRQSLSRDPDEYVGNGPQALAARQAADAGLNLHAGESLSYFLTSHGDRDRSRRVRVAALRDADTQCDPAAYVRLLRRAMNTILWPAGVELDEALPHPPWEEPPPRRTRKRRATPARQLDLFTLAGDCASPWPGGECE